MSAANVQIGQVVTFTYNGKVRVVKIEKVGADYIQGENISVDGMPAPNKYSSYNFSKMG